jgi:hypothetical protein
MSVEYFEGSDPSCSILLFFQVVIVEYRAAHLYDFERKTCLDYMDENGKMLVDFVVSWTMHICEL